MTLVEQSVEVSQDRRFYLNNRESNKLRLRDENGDMKKIPFCEIAEDGIDEDCAEPVRDIEYILQERWNDELEAFRLDRVGDGVFTLPLPHIEAVQISCSSTNEEIYTDFDNLYVEDGFRRDISVEGYCITTMYVSLILSVVLTASADFITGSITNSLYTVSILSLFSMASASFLVYAVSPYLLSIYERINRMRGVRQYSSID